MEVSLVNTMSRESVLRNYLNEVKDKYDYVLIDCMPSLGMITVNALAAADSVIIPVQAHYLPAKGMSQLLQTIGRVKKNINPILKMDGALMTMVDSRTNFAKEISSLLRDNYGDKLRVFKTEIPLAIKAAETSAEGKSIRAMWTLITGLSAMTSRNWASSLKKSVCWWFRIRYGTALPSTVPPTSPPVTTSTRCTCS